MNAFFVYFPDLLTCGTKASHTAICVSQFSSFLIGRGQYRSDDQLGDPFPIGDRLLSITVIVQRHDKFPPVVAVDNANLISWGKATLAGKTAAGIEQPGAALRQLHG